MVSLSEVQQLYRQWQDGKLLDNEERNALRIKPVTNPSDQTFAQVLKAATDNPTTA